MARRLISVLMSLGLVATLTSCHAGPAGGRPVTFRSQDGFLLEGELFGSGTKVVILSHMYPADQSSWFAFAKQLSSRGYEVLTFNFRGYGKSQGRKEIRLIDRDLLAALQFVNRKGAAKVVLIGASMGGTASIITAAISDVAGVATLSAPVRFMGLDASQAVAAIGAPKLFLATKDDPTGAASAASDLLRGSNDPSAEIQIIGGNEHGTEMVSGSRASEVQKLLEDFLRKVTS